MKMQNGNIYIYIMVQNWVFFFFAILGTIWIYIFLFLLVAMKECLLPNNKINSTGTTKQDLLIDLIFSYFFFFSLLLRPVCAFIFNTLLVESFVPFCINYASIGSQISYKLWFSQNFHIYIYMYCILTKFSKILWKPTMSISKKGMANYKMGLTTLWIENDLTYIL